MSVRAFCALLGGLITFGLTIGLDQIGMYPWGFTVGLPLGVGVGVGLILLARKRGC